MNADFFVFGAKMIEQPLHQSFIELRRHCHIRSRPFIFLYEPVDCQDKLRVEPLMRVYARIRVPFLKVLLIPDMLFRNVCGNVQGFSDLGFAFSLSAGVHQPIDGIDQFAVLTVYLRDADKK